MKKLQFHSPAEHTIGGQRYDAESKLPKRHVHQCACLMLLAVQIVHQKEGAVGNADTLIVSVLLKRGPESEFLKSLAWTARALPKVYLLRRNVGIRADWTVTVEGQ